MIVKMGFISRFYRVRLQRNRLNVNCESLLLSGYLKSVVFALQKAIESIKKEYLNRNKTKTKSPYLLDILDDSESEGCAACFI